MAHVSIDLDTVDVHLAGYGIRRPPCDRIYRKSVPRILDLLERLGVRATFFVIARDSESEAALLREIARRGHEIASHSVTHPLPFATLDDQTMWRELHDSRARLEQITGRAVLGFRAPGWDVDATVLDAIAAAGYCYDASVLPSPAVLSGIILRYALSGGNLDLRSFLRPARLAFSPRLPYRRGDGTWEFPVAVSPLLRIPFTHTLWHLAPARLCRGILRGFRRRRATLCYQFHAVDLLDLTGDAIDSRLARHPGVRLPLDVKRGRLEEALTEISRSHAVLPYAEAVAETGHGAPSPHAAVAC